MTATKADLLAKNREVLAQMEKLRAELKQTQRDKPARAPHGAPSPQPAAGTLAAPVAWPRGGKH